VPLNRPRANAGTCLEHLQKCRPLLALRDISQSQNIHLLVNYGQTRELPEGCACLLHSALSQGAELILGPVSDSAVAPSPHCRAALRARLSPFSTRTKCRHQGRLSDGLPCHVDQGSIRAAAYSPLKRAKKNLCRSCYLEHNQHGLILCKAVPGSLSFQLRIFAAAQPI